MVKVSQSIPQERTRAAPLVEIDDLAFGYTNQPLLYGVQVSVWSGEMVGLLGPNGSGKTTLLRLLSGILHPQQGRILLDGRDLAAWAGAELRGVSLWCHRSCRYP